MHSYLKSASHSSRGLLSTHAVLRNTYALLGLALLVSAFSAALSTYWRLPSPGFLLTLGVYYGLLFAIQRHANQALGIVFVFLLTGFMGYTLGPLLNLLLSSTLGTQVLMTALFGTGGAFVGLSAYAFNTQEDLGFLRGFLFSALWGCLIASVISLIFQMPLLSIMVSCAMVLISSGMILFQLSEIIHGGERNYILATVSLFVSLYNLFIHLVQLLAFFSNDRRD